MNTIDPDIKFIFEEISIVAKFLVAQCSLKNYQLIFDILSLGERMLNIVSENKEQHLNKLKSCLIQHGHPEEVLDYTIAKLFSTLFRS